MNTVEYAKHRGISKMRVSQYIAQGKISATKVGRGYEIDPEIADQELAGSMDQRQPRPSAVAAPPPPKPKPVAIEKPLVTVTIDPPAPLPAPLPEPAPLPDPAPLPAPQPRPAPQRKTPKEPITQPMQGGPTYAEAQRAREVYRAERERIKLLQEKGELIIADDVKKEVMALTRAIRDNMMSIPDRVASQLAVMRDPHEVRQLLDSEINTALRMLANG